jgi:lipoyl(octanoyl) transferase
MASPSLMCRFVTLAGGPLSYGDVEVLQHRAQTARIGGEIGDTVYLLEHLPVVTIGRSGKCDSNLLTSAQDLKSRGIEVVAVDRGGDITYHSPGQLVGYPILDLNNYGRDLHRYLRMLEQALIDVLAGYGLDSCAIPGLTGVWVDGKKIAAIGIKVTRWVTMHGFALNIDVDLSPMRRDIIPCGIPDRDVTSLAELGIATTRREVEAKFVRAFCGRFGAQGVLEESSLSRALAGLHIESA